MNKLNLTQLRILNTWMSHKITRVHIFHAATEEFISEIEYNYDEIIDKVKHTNYKSDLEDLLFLLAKLKADNFTSDQLTEFRVSLSYTFSEINEFNRKRKIIASRRKEILSILTRSYN